MREVFFSHQTQSVYKWQSQTVLERKGRRNISFYHLLKKCPWEWKSSEMSLEPAVCSLLSPGLVGWLTRGRRLMCGCAKPTSRALCEGNEWYENMVMNLKPLVINHKQTWLFNFFRFQGKESTDCSGFCASTGPPTKQFCFWKKIG